MFRNIGIFIASLALLAPTFAMDAARSQAEQVIALQRGETLYVFKDGLMAKEDKFGRPAYLGIGETVQSVDGQKIAVKGNEVARLALLLKTGHQR